MKDTQTSKIGEAMHSRCCALRIDFELRQQIRRRPQRSRPFHKLWSLETLSRPGAQKYCETVHAHGVVLYPELVATNFWQCSKHADRSQVLPISYFPLPFHTLYLLS